MDVIKTFRTEKGTNITLMELGFDDTSYEVQVSDDDNIFDSEGYFTTKKAGLNMFQVIKNEYLLKEQYNIHTISMNKHQMKQVIKLLDNMMKRIE